MDLRLQGKRALVTGSSIGLGEAIARALAAEGVAVAIHGRQPKRTYAVAADIEAHGGRVAVVLGDPLRALLEPLQLKSTAKSVNQAA